MTEEPHRPPGNAAPSSPSPTIRPPPAGDIVGRPPPHHRHLPRPRPSDGFYGYSAPPPRGVYPPPNYASPPPSGYYHHYYPPPPPPPPGYYPAPPPSLPPPVPPPQPDTKRKRKRRDLTNRAAAVDAAAAAEAGRETDYEEEEEMRFASAFARARAVARAQVEAVPRFRHTNRAPYCCCAESATGAGVAEQEVEVVVKEGESLPCPPSDSVRYALERQLAEFGRDELVDSGGVCSTAESPEEPLPKSAYAAASPTATATAAGPPIRAIVNPPTRWSMVDGDRADRGKGKDQGRGDVVPPGASASSPDEKEKMESAQRLLPPSLPMTAVSLSMLRLKLILNRLDGVHNDMGRVLERWEESIVTAGNGGGGKGGSSSNRDCEVRLEAVIRAKIKIGKMKERAHETRRRYQRALLQIIGKGRGGGIDRGTPEAATAGPEDHATIEIDLTDHAPIEIDLTEVS